MKTTKNLTAVSYNSATFLEGRLEDLRKAGKLANWMYIRHRGEGGDKDHIHLLLMPAEALDTIALTKHFLEVTEADPRPLGIVGLKPCKSVVDWLRYSVHDAEYLAVKGEYGKIPYRREDFRTGNDLEARLLWLEVDTTPLPSPDYSAARELIRRALDANGGFLDWRLLVDRYPFAPRDMAALKEFWMAHKAVVRGAVSYPEAPHQLEDTSDDV